MGKNKSGGEESHELEDFESAPSQWSRIRGGSVGAVDRAPRSTPLLPAHSFTEWACIGCRVPFRRKPHLEDHR
jgi:hypothetical protein